MMRAASGAAPSSTSRSINFDTNEAFAAHCSQLQQALQGCNSTVEDIIALQAHREEVIRARREALSEREAQMTRERESVQADSVARRRQIDDEYLAEMKVLAEQPVEGEGEVYEEVEEEAQEGAAVAAGEGENGEGSHSNSSSEAQEKGEGQEQ